jgi:hypothetical protein
MPLSIFSYLHLHWRYRRPHRNTQDSKGQALALTHVKVLDWGVGGRDRQDRTPRQGSASLSWGPPAGEEKLTPKRSRDRVKLVSDAMNSPRYTRVSPDPLNALYLPGIVQIVPQYNIGRPNLAANVLHWHTTVTDLGTGTLNAIQATFDPLWFDLWALVGASEASYVGSIVTDMSSNTGAQAGNQGFVPKHPTNSGPQLGENTAYLLSLHTDTRYRGGHGRVYLPAISVYNINNDGETMGSAIQPAVVTAWNNLVTAMESLPVGSGGPLSPVIWHKKLSSAPNTFELVTGITANALFASQRRRLRKVSRHKKRIA